MSTDHLDEDARALAELGYVGWVAVGWLIFICILFVLPPASPITVDTFNYAPIAVAVVIAFVIVSWFVGGRKNFMNKAKDEHTTMSLDKVLDE